jgi:hypothetical protein
MSDYYLIKVTREQLDGLKHAVAHTQMDYARELPEREKGLAFWENYSDRAPEKPKYLAMARENLEYVRTRLALVTSASEPVYGAKLVSKPSGRKS